MRVSRSWTTFLATTFLIGVVAAWAQGRWDFEEGQENAAPQGFSFARTGNGRPGQWMIKTEPDAPSGTHVLAQLDGDATDFRFPIAVADDPRLTDLQLSVKCRLVSGQVDQACGLVFRYQDENNYYLTRANALEHNIGLYHVVNGNRQQFASWNGTIASAVWHELRVAARGDSFAVYWDGQSVLDAHDQTFRGPGRVGVWTKADSITFFDDLIVTSLEPRATQASQ